MTNTLTDDDRCPYCGSSEIEVVQVMSSSWASKCETCGAKGPVCDYEHFAVDAFRQRPEEGRLREALRKTQRFLSDERWGTWPYMEGSDIYGGIDRLKQVVGQALNPRSEEKEERCPKTS